MKSEHTYVRTHGLQYKIYMKVIRSSYTATRVRIIEPEQQHQEV